MCVCVGGGGEVVCLVELIECFTKKENIAA